MSKGNRNRLNRKKNNFLTQSSSGSDMKSPYYEDMKDVFVEDFRGFQKDLRECGFWSSVQFETPSTLQELMEECKKKPMDYAIISMGDFTGIKHCAFWNEKLNCFVMWRHTPKRILDGSDPFINLINHPLSKGMR